MRRWLVVLGIVCLASAADAATLTWTDNATNEEGVKIERRTGVCVPNGTGWAEVGSVATDIKTYTESPAAGYAYCYRIRAFNHQYLDGTGSLQYSAYSNEAGLSLPLPAPTAAPSQLGVVP